MFVSVIIFSLFSAKAILKKILFARMWLYNITTALKGFKNMSSMDAIFGPHMSIFSAHFKSLVSTMDASERWYKLPEALYLGTAAAIPRCAIFKLGCIVYSTGTCHRSHTQERGL